MKKAYRKIPCKKEHNALSVHMPLLFKVIFQSTEGIHWKALMKLSGRFIITSRAKSGKETKFCKPHAGDLQRCDTTEKCVLEL